MNMRKAKMKFSALKIIFSCLSAILTLGTFALSSQALAQNAASQNGPSYSVTWRSLATTNSPAWRTWTNMTYADTLGRIVLWGGWGATPVNDLVALDPVNLDWQTLEPNINCPGNTGFDVPNGSDENGLVFDPINNALWLSNGGSGYRCLSFAPARTAGVGTTTSTIVDTSLTSQVVDFYKDHKVYGMDKYALVTAYNPSTHVLTLNASIGMTAGSTYKLFADTGEGTWMYSLDSRDYWKMESRHWNYAGPIPSGRRLSPGFASNGVDGAILFGGVSVYDISTWIYDNSTWKLDFATKSYSLMSPMGTWAPAARGQISNQFVYDAGSNRYVLFGGRCFDSTRCAGKMNDTWIFDPQSNTWTEVNPATSPPGRDQAQMYYDSLNNVVVLFGGVSNNGTILNDIWVFSVANQLWTQVTTVNNTPVPLYLAPIAYSPNTGCGYLVYGNTTGQTIAYGIYEICLVNNAAPGNSPPVANISLSPMSGTTVTVFNMSGSNSVDSDGSIVSYSWSFGDGTTASGPNITKGYAAPGTYTVTLTVTDNLGASETASVPIVLTNTGSINIPPAVNLTLPATGSSYLSPATVNLAATASDSDGTVTRVDFYRGTTLIGTKISAPYAYADVGVGVGSYSYTAVAVDNAGVSTTSSAVAVTVTAAGGGGSGAVNVAAQANGGVATASSAYNASYPAVSANNGDRKGLNWGSGGGWNDATTGNYPDWLQVTFSSAQSIGEIDVFTVQDNYQSPVEPTAAMAFTQYGITSFQVQYWDGSVWVDIPGGNVTNNNQVWRKFTFTPITTDRIRVLVSGALNGYSRITEIEAWTASGGTVNIPPAVNLTLPATGSSYLSPATVNLAATASDSDGTVTRVDFYRGTTLIGTKISAPYAYADVGVGVGSYSYTAVAVDNAGVSTTSSAVAVTVTAAGGGGSGAVNVAAQANGGVATASSAYNASYPAVSANNGDRKGLNWGSGGGWNDATTGNYPDWLQVTFSSAQSIGEIDVFTVQDNYQSPVEPTAAMAFTQYGITSFQVQYWDGSVWVDIPGGNVTNNNQVWRKFTFTPITTDRIRVLVSGALNGYSRITEIEAWTL